MDANARIIDRGYQHYDGIRLGLGHSEWVMLKAALLRGLGLRRNFRNKIMPWLLIVIAFLPSVVILGIQITISLALTSPYAGLYASIMNVVFILFAGLVAADLICSDLRERVLSLYFSAPITRLHYIAAQVIGLVLLLLLLTVVPYVILFFGQALLAPAFALFVGNHLSDLRSVLFGGTLIAFFYGSLAMAMSAFTDRRAYATGGFLGLVLQDTFLFADTVMENIRYGRLEATDEECVEAARMAEADHFIRQLPQGYQTNLSERAGNLSQGQRQLLSIARAILADPAILVLDEATSSVDTRTEVRIQKALLRLMQGRTSFVIAHRLSTIRDADKVVVINNGEIVEQGSHQELLDRHGFYHRLYLSQFKGNAI